MVDQHLSQTQFWLTKSLSEMSENEWEAICDGCGKCCLNTFIDSEDEDEFTATDQLREGEQLIFTNIVCQYLDNNTCGCSEYENRQTLVPSCVKLTKENLKDIFLDGHITMDFLPPYAPELNPVEYLWAWLKRHALANYCPNSIAELAHTTRGKLRSAQRRTTLVAAFWKQAELF